MDAYAYVLCENCGKQPLTKAQYIAQLSNPWATWRCPCCRDDAEFDDEAFERIHCDGPGCEDGPEADGFAPGFESRCNNEHVVIEDSRNELAQLLGDDDDDRLREDQEDAMRREWERGDSVARSQRDLDTQCLSDPNLPALLRKQAF